MKKLSFSLMAIMLMAFTLFSCDKDDDNDKNETKPVTSIALSKSTLTLDEGQSETLTYTITPADATNLKVTWSSNNTSVATVSEGKVTAVSEGSADITVTTEDGNKTATCKVTVSSSATEPVAVTDVAITPATDVSLTVGKTATLSVVITPDNATNKDVTWESLNPDIATVDNGVVTGVKSGTAVIRVTAADGSEKYAEKSVTVTEESSGSDAKAEYDNSNYGLYKGILVGSSGTLIIEIKNGSDVVKATVNFDGNTDELVSTSTIREGVAIDGAIFTGTISSFKFSVDADGKNPTVTEIKIEGHDEVTGSVLKETSTDVAGAYEGTTVGGDNHKGVLNFIRNDNTYYGISKGDDGIIFLFKGDIKDGAVSGSSKTTFFGIEVTLTYSGTFDGASVSGTWETSWSGGENSGTFSGKKTL